MPDTIRKVDYYYITAPDKAGEGARVLGALRDAGVNLLAVHAFPSARRSQIDVVPSDSAAFVSAAKVAYSWSKVTIVPAPWPPCSAGWAARASTSRRRARCAPDPAATGRCYGLSPGT